MPYIVIIFTVAIRFWFSKSPNFVQCAVSSSEHKPILGIYLVHCPIFMTTMTQSCSPCQVTIFLCERKLEKDRSRQLRIRKLTIVSKDWSLNENNKKNTQVPTQTCRSRSVDGKFLNNRYTRKKFTVYLIQTKNQQYTLILI